MNTNPYILHQIMLLDELFSQYPLAELMCHCCDILSTWKCKPYAQTHECLHPKAQHRPLSDRLETPLRWASADPIAFVMLMSTSRCTARHSGACRCAPIDFAYPRGSRFQPKQGSDSSRRARDTAATMLHFMYFWRHRFLCMDAYNTVDMTFDKHYWISSWEMYN